MRMPYHNSLSRSEEFQSAFGGYNHTENCSELEFYEMKNMSSDLFPILSPRKKRGKMKLSGEKIKAILAKNKFCHVADNAFYIDNVPVEDFSVDPMYDEDGNELRISLTSMGAYVLIFPQKLYVNTASPADHGSILKKISLCPVFVITDRDLTFAQTTDITYPTTKEEGEKRGFYITEETEDENTVHNLYVKTESGWVQKEPCFGMSDLYHVNFPDIYGKVDLTIFKPGDTVTVTGLDALGLGGEKVVENVVDFIVGKIIIFKGYFPPDGEELAAEYVTLTQEIPNLDFVVENGNRLWGCRYGTDLDGAFVNQIYASRLGDFRVWNDFSGESSDSYAVNLGSDGPFTGAARYGENVIFFKEHCFHRVYGNLPENYQLQTYENDGLQKGSEKSLAVVENVLFYKGIDGFYAFDNTVPQMISAPLGKEMLCEAVGGVCNQKYYASARDTSGRYHLYAYDVQKNLWHKEDELCVLDTTFRGAELYCLTKDGVQVISSTETAVENTMRWYAETGIIGKSTPDRKAVQKLKIRAEVSPEAMVQVMIEYDSSGNFEPVFLMEGRVMQSYSVPVRIHRCDHFKLLFMGVGPAKIHSLSKVLIKRSDKG